MNLSLTESQYKNLLRLLNEQVEPTASEPEKGTSDKQAGGQGYPQVGKWESGVTRGPGNQIGITKWADVVGSKLNRGKANPLKEQEAIGRGSWGVKPDNLNSLPADVDTPIKKYKTPWQGEIEIPADSAVLLYKQDDDLVSAFAEKNPDGTVVKDKEGYILMAADGRRCPSQAVLRSILPIGTLRTFVTKKDNIQWGVLLGGSGNRWNIYPDYYIKNPNQTEEGKVNYIAYNPANYLHVSFGTTVKRFAEEHWVDLAIIVAAIVTGGVFGAAAVGMLGSELAATEAFSLLGWSVTNRALAVYVGEALVWVGRGGYQMANGKPGAGGIDMAFGILFPALHGIGLSKWGIDVTDDVIKSTAQKVMGKTVQEVEMLSEISLEKGGLTQAEKMFVRDAGYLSPKAYKEMVLKVTEKVKLGKNGPKALKKVQEVIRNSKLGALLRKNWYTWVPTVLAHDFYFISLLEKLETAVGMVDKESIDMVSKAYKQNPVKTAEILSEASKNSKDLPAFKENFSKKFNADETNAKFDKDSTYMTTDKDVDNFRQAIKNSKNKPKVEN